MDKEQKNIFYLIDAWKNVENKGSWSFYVIGADFCDQKLIAEFNKNNIQALPYTANGAVSDWLKKSSVCLLGSIYEGFPTVILEAVANGNAIVTTKYDGFSDEIVRDGENGFVIHDRFCTKKFTEAMQKLILNSGLLLKMQRASLKLYEGYAKTDVVQLWKKEFQN